MVIDPPSWGAQHNETRKPRWPDCGRNGAAVKACCLWVVSPVWLFIPPCGVTGLTPIPVRPLYSPPAPLQRVCETEYPDRASPQHPGARIRRIVRRTPRPAHAPVPKPIHILPADDPWVVCAGL